MSIQRRITRLEQRAINMQLMFCLAAAFAILTPDNLIAQGSYDYRSRGTPTYTFDWNGETNLTDMQKLLVVNRSFIHVEDRPAVDVAELDVLDPENNVINIINCKFNFLDYDYQSILMFNANVHEGAFYHTTDPASTFGFYDSDQIRLYWRPDTRFEVGAYDHAVSPWAREHDSYIVFRIDENDSVTTIGTTTETSLIDPNVNYAAPYKYIIKSRYLEDAVPVEIDFSDTLSVIAEPRIDPFVWINEVAATPDSPANASVLHVIIGSNIPSVGDLNPEAEVRMPAFRKDRDLDFSYNGFTSTTIDGYPAYELSVAIPDTDAFRVPGTDDVVEFFSGFAVRIKYGLEPNIQRTDYHLTTPNNRFVSRSGKSFLMIPDNVDYQNAFIDQLTSYFSNRLGTDAPGKKFDGRAFDGFYGDMAMPDIQRWHANGIPREYDQANYALQFIDLLQTVRASTPMEGKKIIINAGAGYVDSTATYLTLSDYYGAVLVDGIQKEGPGAKSNKAVYGNSWIRGFNECYDAVNMTEDPSVQRVLSLTIVNIDSTQVRLYGLASYYLFKDDERRAMYAGMFYHNDDTHVVLYPEAQINIGSGAAIDPLNIPAPDTQMQGKSGDPDNPDENYVTEAQLEHNPIMRIFNNPGPTGGSNVVILNFSNPDPDESGYEIVTAPTYGAEYMLRLSKDDLPNGGHFWAEKINGNEITIMPARAVVLLVDSLASPSLASEWALYNLYSTADVTSVIAIEEPLTWNDGPIAEVIVDATAIGGTAEMALNDDGVGGDTAAGDGIWSSAAFQCNTSAGGEYQLPVYIRSEDIAEVANDHFDRYTSLKVYVIEKSALKFVNRSGDTGDLYTQTGEPYASVAVDYDQDGLKDLFVGIKSPNPSVLYHSDNIGGGVPSFRADEGAFTLEEAPGPGIRGLSAADYDNDGDPDIFAAHYEHPRLYENNGSGHFYDMSKSIVYAASQLDTTIMSQSYVGSWADYNNDGWLDIYIGKDEGNQPDPDPKYYLENPTKSGCTDAVFKNTYDEQNDRRIFEYANQETGFTGAQATFTAIWGDVNGDGWPDLFVGDLTQSGGPVLWINDGDGSGSFTNGTQQWFSGIGVPNQVVSAAWIDYDNDLDLDLAVGRIVTGENFKLYRNNGSSFSEADMSALGFPEKHCNINGISVLDYDRNGMCDLLLVPDLEQSPVYLYGNFMFGEEQRFVNTTYDMQLTHGKAGGVTVADFDNDGRNDLYFGRASQDSVFFYRSTKDLYQEPPPDICIQLAGSGGNNYDGINAKVVIDAGGQSQMLTKDGGTGRGLQGPDILQFGLGDYTGSTVTATVHWPDGSITVKECPVDTLTVIENDTIPGIDPESVTSLYQPGPGGTDWIFEWVSECSSDIRMDRAEISSTYDPSSPCYCGGNRTFKQGDSGVEVEITPASGGGFLHRITWHDGCCYPGCSYQFRVRSATRFANEWSAWYTFKRMKTCAG